jgi:hypothetical protein
MSNRVVGRTGNRLLIPYHGLRPQARSEQFTQRTLGILRQRITFDGAPARPWRLLRGIARLPIRHSDADANYAGLTRTNLRGRG